MTYEKIKEIFQTADQAEVNKKLKDNFRLLKIFSGRVIQDNIELVQPIYVLGRETQ